MAGAAEAEKRLVWQSEYEAQNLSGKALFQHFIGAHTKLWKKVRAFPMLLWAEQAQALASGALPDKQQKRQNRKRNRSSDAGDEEAEQEEQRRVKVKTEGWFDSAVALFRMVATAVMSPITYVAAFATAERAECEDENKKEEEDATVGGDAATRLHQEWRNKVFLDLTRQGYLVGPGAAYGGDYVIYRSDPHKEHSMACVRIIHGGTEPLFRDVATFARVCRKARKTAVLALGGDDGTIKYISAGFAGVISYAKNKGKTRGARRKPILAQDVEEENPAQLLDEEADSDSGDEAYFSDVSADL